MPERVVEPWITQLQQDAQGQGMDEATIRQRITRFLAEHQGREANARGTLEQGLFQLRQEYQSAMTETAISFNRISEKYQCQGNRQEQLRQLVHNNVTQRLEEFHVLLHRPNEWIAEVTRETDRRSRDMCDLISKFIDEQHDIRKVVENLAQKIDAIQKGTHPGESAGSSAGPEQASTSLGNRGPEEKGRTPH